MSKKVAQIDLLDIWHTFHRHLHMHKKREGLASRKFFFSIWEDARKKMNNFLPLKIVIIVIYTGRKIYTGRMFKQ